MCIRLHSMNISDTVNRLLASWISGILFVQTHTYLDHTKFYRTLKRITLNTIKINTFRFKTWCLRVA